uniref:Ribosomal protein L28 n=1 Tax=Globodera rostochiensis TaxID=31243 RepID=A0A914I0Y3_GLORO
MSPGSFGEMSLICHQNVVLSNCVPQMQLRRLKNPTRQKITSSIRLATTECRTCQKLTSIRLAKTECRLNK